jgi:hypothetical protein
MKSFAPGMIIGVLKRPAVSFFSYFFIVTLTVFSIKEGGNSILFLYLLFPWIVILLLLLNLPFFSALFRYFKMSEEKKRNHALEHGTILLLRRKYEPSVRIGGFAESQGFRIWGIKHQQHLWQALKDFRNDLSHGKAEEIISRACGSQVVTAQGFGLTLLTASWLAIIFIDPAMSISGIILAANVVAYFLLRGRLGAVIQKKFFLSVNFNNFSILSIDRVKKRPFLERDPVYFVKINFTSHNLNKDFEKPC